MLISTFLLFGFLSCILIWYWKRLGKKYLPGPIAFPIIGSVPQFVMMSLGRSIYQTQEAMCKKYGALCGFFIGSEYFVFSQDPVLGKELLNHDGILAKFPLSSVTYKLYGPGNYGISQAHGHVCKEMRKFSARGLKTMGFGRQSAMNRILRESAVKYLNKFENQRAENNGIVPMHESFLISTLGILWTLMTANEFSLENKRLLHLVDSARALLKDKSLTFDPAFVFPFLAAFPNISKFNEAKAFWTEIRAYLQEILDERRKSEEWKNNPFSLMDLFLVEIEENSDPLFTDAQCVQTCMDLFLAGLDSIANTLEWGILYLVANPEVYRKVVEEIDQVIGQNPPKLDDRSKMPYTEATMLEIMRIENAIIYTMRAPLKEVKFREYTIPQNTHVVIKLDCFHKSKAIWGDPEVFRPERFLNENMEIVNSEKVFTFGYGKRACIGENPSKMTTFIFLTTLLQEYDLKYSPNNEKPSLEADRGILISNPKPYFIHATKREIN